MKLVEITMPKRNITYIKPADPKFLHQLKQQIGYKEGPTVETKRQKLGLEGDFNNEEEIEREDERPQVVVVNSGDLTAEEVAIEETRLAKVIAEAPADLTKPIIFRKRHTSADKKELETVSHSKKDFRKAENSNKKHIKSRDSSSKLSFNVEEEEEED